MKVVIYHAEANVAKKRRPGIYKELTALLKKNVNSFGFPLIHLTTAGHEGWGDENYFYDLDPKEINYNRELCYIDFLKNSANDTDVYWFTEPDWRINQLFPPLENDIDFLLRDDNAPLHPGWRLAKRSALPVFEETLKCYDISPDQKIWGGDSTGLRNLYDNFGRPTDTFKAVGCSVGLRYYKEYGMRKGKYTQQFKADHKEELLERYGKE
jgi:hypothetical protein